MVRTLGCIQLELLIAEIEFLLVKPAFSLTHIRLLFVTQAFFEKTERDNSRRSASFTSETCNPPTKEDVCD